MNCTKMKMCILYEHMPKNFEILHFELHIKSISKFLGGGGKFNSVGLDHSGSQPFNCESDKLTAVAL